MQFRAAGIFATFLIAGRSDGKLSSAQKGGIWGTKRSATPYDSRIHLHPDMSSALISVAMEDGQKDTTTPCEARTLMMGDKDQQYIYKFRLI